MPVLSHVEGPVLSHVEGPVLSHVEGPVLSHVVTKSAGSQWPASKLTKLVKLKTPRFHSVAAINFATFANLVCVGARAR
jgi:hypothetical protein